MKKIVFILLLFVAFQSEAQTNRFPSTDSLKNYILRYVRNSTMEAFSNLRLQNVVYGTVQLLDSLTTGSGGGVDSIWIVDAATDTLKYRKAGVTYVVGAISGGGGSTDTTSLSNRINLKLNISDTAAMLANYVRLQRFNDSLTAVRATVNGKLSNITGLVTAGTNVTVTGSGTSGSPYVVSSSGGGGGGSQTLQQTTDFDSTTTNGVFIGSDNITRNDTVQAAPYSNFVTGAANYGSVQNRWAINFDPALRIRQRGAALAVKIYLDSVPVRLTSFYITIWRKSATTAYNIIDSINVLDQLVNGTNLIQLPANWYVLDGDYVGWGYTSTGAGSNFLTTGTLSAGIGIYYLDQATHPIDGTGWVGSPNSLTAYLPIELYTYAPDAVFIGDSKTAGFNNSVGAYTDPATTTVRNASFPDLVSNALNWKIQNMGIGNQISSQIAGRFQRDVVDKHPMYAIIEMGVNDVFINTSTAAIMANFNTVLSLCTTNNIKPVIILILPWTNGTNARNMQIDTINTNLIALATTYNALLVDARSTIGKFRVGGTAGNFWDIQTSPDYDDDGVHFTQLGYDAIAAKVVEVIKASGSIPFVNPNPKGAILRVNSRTKGIGLPTWNEVVRMEIDANQETGVGVMGYQEDEEEGVYVKTSAGMKRLAENNYGTHAERIALTGLLPGTRFFQTDALLGDYVWNGSTWIRNLPSPVINQYILNAAYNVAPTGSTLTVTGGADFNNINNVKDWNMNSPVLFQTNVGAGSGNYFFTGTSFPFIMAEANHVIWQRIRVRNNLSTPSERFILRFGVGGVTAGDSHTGFSGFVYCDSINSGQWQLVSANGATTVNTSIPVAVNTTYDLVIVCNALETKFYVNGVYAGAIGSVTVVSFRGIVSSMYKTVTGAGGGAFILDRHIMYDY